MENIHHQSSTTSEHVRQEQTCDWVESSDESWLFN